MAQLPIKKGTDGILRQRAKPVPKVTKKINKLLKDMLHTMYSAQGVGLAAPQVGKNLRLVVVDVGKGRCVWSIQCWISLREPSWIRKVA